MSHDGYNEYASMNKDETCLLNDMIHATGLNWNAIPTPHNVGIILNAEDTLKAFRATLKSVKECITIHKDSFPVWLSTYQHSIVKSYNEYCVMLNNSLGGDRKKFENYVLLTNGEHAPLLFSIYSCDIMNNRWPEVEHIIFKTTMATKYYVYQHCISTYIDSAKMLNKKNKLETNMLHGEKS